MVRWQGTRAGTRIPRALTALTAALAVGLLAACSGGADDATATGAAGRAAGDSGGNSAAEPEDGAPADGDDAQRHTGKGDRVSARVLPADRDIVYRGAITVRVRDVARAAGRAESLTLGAEGVVFSQEMSAGDGRRGGGEARLTLRVPPSRFAATLDGLGRLGRELDRARTAEDVTTQVADTGSRVRSQERSVERVRALLAEADTIGEVVAVEAELARREADLESLQAQLARLQDVTEMATIEVTLVGRHIEPAPEPDDDLGFLSGLRGGWDALGEIALVVLTVFGALLPFAVLVAVVGVPAYWVLRSRRRPAAEPAPEG